MSSPTFQLVKVMWGGSIPANSTDPRWIPNAPQGDFYGVTVLALSPGSLSIESGWINYGTSSGFMFTVVNNSPNPIEYEVYLLQASNSDGTTITSDMVESLQS